MRVIQRGPAKHRMRALQFHDVTPGAFAHVDGVTLDDAPHPAA